ncbi:class D sortase [Planococcus lenghuensis]|uniref:class D sortase n=1 Tax=Planococcus lenghuensis TaxID=2213202 RepID=UPI001E507FA9|nr:class D sortase [Planococcus lenghuensis]
MGRRRKPTGRIALSLLSILLVFFGVAFAGYNTFAFATGYFAGEEVDIEVNTQIPRSSGPSSTEPVVAQKSPETRSEIDLDPLYSSYPEEGEKFGELLIPKLDTAYPVYAGADPEELAEGVGHYSKSVLPGMNNNSVLAGHRDTVFRKLGEVGEGDYLIVKTAAGKFTYQVNKVRIVDDMDKTVIVPTEEARLTLITCYPFNFIGDAPKRYVLVAELIDSTA